MRTAQYDEIDADTLARAEREARDRPPNSAMWDDRLYVTHGPVIAWAERGDDILAESNYACVRDYLQAIATAEDGDAQVTADDYVIDATISDWLVGSLRQVFVRIRNDHGEFTHAFRAATFAAISLRDDYPVWDESDFTSRESEAHDAELADALNMALHHSDYAPDDDEQDTIRATFYGLLSESDDRVMACVDMAYPAVDWDAVQSAVDSIWTDEFGTDYESTFWVTYARELSAGMISPDQLTLI